MLTFLLIPDNQKFLQLVDKSRGDVLLHLPDGSKHSPKAAGSTLELLDSAKSRKTGMEISLTDLAGMKPFIQYMMEAAL